jgi:hypothetical protein
MTNERLVQEGRDMQDTDSPSNEPEAQASDKPATKKRRYLLVSAIVLAAVALLWALQNKSDSYYIHEGIYLGMTNAQVLETLSQAGPFKEVAILGEDGAVTMTFEYLEPSPAPSPWSRFLIGSIDGKVVSISTMVSDLPNDQAAVLLEEAVARYGKPDETKRKGDLQFSQQTHIWGDVTYPESDLIYVRPEAHGRAIIFRHWIDGKVSSVNILVTRDGDGPHL